MRVDLHVHTVHSGLCTVPGLSRVCRESYNEPRALYQTLKARGMDLVTVTDHDSIDAAEELRHYPDFFLSEEVTCTMPSGTEMHAGVYGIQEADHTELQRRRHDVESLLAYCTERGLFVSVNHIYSSLTGRRTQEDFDLFARSFHGVETRNGQIIRVANKLAAQFAARYDKPAIGGSDAHTLHGAGKTWTEVRGAVNVQDFLAGVRRGHGLAEGESGDYMKLTTAVFGIGGSFLRNNARMAALGALLPLAAVVTLGNYFCEQAFAWYWGAKHRPVEPSGLVQPAGAGVTL